MMYQKAKNDLILNIKTLPISLNDFKPFLQEYGDIHIYNIKGITLRRRHGQGVIN